MLIRDWCYVATTSCATPAAGAPCSC